MADVSGEDPIVHEPTMTLVSVRIPAGDLEALRIAAAATGGSVAHLIRSGVQRELTELRRDPSFMDDLRARRDELSRLVADLEENVPGLVGAEAEDSRLGAGAEPAHA